MNTVISNSLLDAACELVEQRTGLRAGTQFRATLHDVLHALPPKDPAVALRQLRGQPETSDLWQTLIHTLTIGETYFFRDAAVFQLLHTHILPQIIAARRQESDFHLNIWCAGCSTGEEPISTAIVLHTLLDDLPRWQINITGTDINRHALAHARAGVYRKWAFRHTEADFQARYFDRTEKGWKIKPFIHDMVHFEYANLLTVSPRQPVDLILCRNVLIYFSAKASQQIAQLLHESLLPEGWLIMGHSEVLPAPHAGWHDHNQHQATVYQKHPASPAKAAAASVPHTQPEFYAEALQALRVANTDKAERLLHEILAQQADSQAHTLLALIMANRHERAAAHYQIDLALHHEPLWADAYYLRAVLFLEEEHPGLAQEALRSALYCQQDHMLSALLLGLLYLREGDSARAARLWEKARQAAADLPPDAYISDMSDFTGSNFIQLINDQLEGLHPS
ncbi:MAG: hypothetical protein K8L99_22900 [Anaerolineae bacterium]|nr:hypothetical protein [Anaerolineae bacterium]